MAAARKSKPRARTRKRAKRSSARLPVVEQRHLALLGLGLVALSVFLAFVLYGGWQGGRAGARPGVGARAGERRVGGVDRLIGSIRYLAPVGIAVAGPLLVLRPVLPAVRPFR